MNCSDLCVWLCNDLICLCGCCCVMNDSEMGKHCKRRQLRKLLKLQVRVLVEELEAKDLLRSNNDHLVCLLVTL